MSLHSANTTALAIASAVHQVEGLNLLMLFGSHARQDAHAGSDWDFAYLGSSTLDTPSLLGILIEVIGSDRVDLVDLSRASGLLRFRAAQDGVALFERRAGIADAFRLEAASFWCDVEPILRRAYDDVLAELKR